MTKAGIPSLIALLIHGVGFFIYLLLLYGGVLPPTILKGCVYILMAAILLFLVIDEWHGISDTKQWQFNIINKFTFIINFIWAAVTVTEIFDAVFLMVFYAAAIFITSVFILTSGLQHGLFNDEC